MFCASVAYPAQEGRRFDFDYFAEKHIPMYARCLGTNCVRCEVHRSLTAPGAPTPQYYGSAYVWVRSAEEFGTSLAQHGAEIFADIPNFTDIEPIRQWSEVVSATEDT